MGGSLTEEMGGSLTEEMGGSPTKEMGGSPILRDGNTQMESRRRGVVEQCRPPPFFWTAS